MTGRADPPTLQTQFLGDLKLPVFNPVASPGNALGRSSPLKRRRGVFMLPCQLLRILPLPLIRSTLSSNEPSRKAKDDDGGYYGDFDWVML